MVNKTIAMEIMCKVQTYAWGKWGKHSLVAKLAHANNINFEIDEAETYAEFWMGTHPNGPSVLKSSGEDLAVWIKSNPDCLGVSRTKFGDGLSFLFKVLSINKPLSIQAHPDKKKAEELHKSFPQIYKDPNHKPEMAIALSNFEVLVGFRPINEIRQFFETVPELRALAREDNVLRFLKTCEDKYDTLRECFSAIMRQPEEKVKECINILLCRLKYSDREVQEAQMYSLVKRLDDEFKDDVGIFGVYLFNHMNLKPGEAVFLGPNIPHAYLSGDCVECMSCSDNVVRAGLTPKYKDVDTLVSILHYMPCTPKDLIFNGLHLDKNTISYSPPIQDFTVFKIEIPNDEEYQLISKESASILFVIQGSGTSSIVSKLSMGSVLFISANHRMTIKATSAMTLFQASTNDILCTSP